jgi:hypothetical protein
VALLASLRYNFYDKKQIKYNILPNFAFNKIMRKFVVTLLLLLYMIPTFGVNVNVHYCGGELSSISIGAKSENPCTCGSKKMKKNCCEDKTFSYEVDDNQAKTQECLLTFSNSFNLDVALPSSFEICYVCFPTIVSEYYFHHPPNNVKPPLYILNQVFRI